MRWFFITILNAFLTARVAFWVAVIAGAIYFGPTIVDTFYGVVDRIDFAIGYPESDR